MQPSSNLFLSNTHVPPPLDDEVGLELAVDAELLLLLADAPPAPPALDEGVEPLPLVDELHAASAAAAAQPAATNQLAAP